MVKRRLKKSVRYSFVLLAILVILGLLHFSGWLKPEVIYGYFILDREPLVEDENIVTFFLNSTGEGKKVSDAEFRILQKYRIGKDAACIRDCISMCEVNKFKYHTAYVQQWGVCRCKCEK